MNESPYRSSIPAIFTGLNHVGAFIHYALAPIDSVLLLLNLFSTFISQEILQMNELVATLSRLPLSF